jgi:hypothetical protein
MCGGSRRSSRLSACARQAYGGAGGRRTHSRVAIGHRLAGGPGAVKASRVAREGRMNAGIRLQPLYVQACRSGGGGARDRGIPYPLDAQGSSSACGLGGRGSTRGQRGSENPPRLWLGGGRRSSPWGLAARGSGVDTAGKTLPHQRLLLWRHWLLILLGAGFVLFSVVLTILMMVLSAR